MQELRIIFRFIAVLVPFLPQLLKWPNCLIEGISNRFVNSTLVTLNVLVICLRHLLSANQNSGRVKDILSLSGRATIDCAQRSAHLH